MRVAFAGFTLDSTTRQLHRGGQELHLSPKAFDLLSTLLANRPGVVDKDTLRDKLWPGTNVVDANLNNLASEIRSVLGDDPQQPRFLRTVHRVGYAFCGAATEDGGTGNSRTSSAAVLASRCFLVWDDRRIVLNEKNQTLGRDPECAIWIDVPGVSRRHARIHLDAEAGGKAAEARATIEDLDSTNGTFVDGKRVRRPIELEDGAEIRVGEAKLTFRLWSESDAPTKRIRRR